MTLRHYDIIRSPVVTEKTAALGSQGKVAFSVARSANKAQIRAAVEKLFSVKVVAVNTLLVKGKRVRVKGIEGRRSDCKKAIVTLAEGYDIDLSAGLS